MDIPSSKNVFNKSKQSSNFRELCPQSCDKIVCEERPDIVCTETTIYEDDPHNKIITHRDSDNLQNDFLILTSGPVRENLDLGFQRLARKESWFVYITLLIIDIMCVLSIWYGYQSQWYQNLVKTYYNEWAVLSFIIIALLFSYIALFIIWDHIQPGELANDTKLSLLFIIGAFLTLLWTTTLFQGNQLMNATLIIFIVFVYEFWLMMYIWNINQKAAIFLIPAVIMYAYLCYLMIHISTDNNIKY